MKRYIRHALPAFLSLAAAFVSRADIVLEQKMESPFLNGTMTLSIKGDKVRTDIGKDTTAIVDIKAGTMTTLMHAQKASMEMKIPDPAAALSAVTGKTGEAAAESMKPKPTGRKEKVAGYDCEIMTIDLPNMKTTMWVAKNFPDYAKLKEELAALNKAGGPNAAAMDLGGMVLKTVAEAQGTKTTVTFVSLKQKPLEDSLFKVPAGYKPMNAGQ